MLSTPRPRVNTARSCAEEPWSEAARRPTRASGAGERGSGATRREQRAKDKSERGKEGKRQDKKHKNKTNKGGKEKTSSTKQNPKRKEKTRERQKGIVKEEHVNSGAQGVERANDNASETGKEAQRQRLSESEPRQTKETQTAHVE